VTKDFLYFFGFTNKSEHLMRIIKPKKLSKGDLIGIISPASAPSDLSSIDRGVAYFESLGYKVEVGKNAAQQKGYFAGDDKERLDDLHYMFRKKEVKAIICTRGGYGSGRLLNSLDYNLIRQNPKIFVGYSDINALQLAIFHKVKMITFGGPMVSPDFSNEMNESAEEDFWSTITSSKKIGKISNPKEEKFYVLNKGRGEGRILGGNLSILVSIMGTEYFPQFKDSILLLEEINEPPYRVDRLFNQLKLAKIFKQVKGIILGRFVNCYESDSEKKTFTLNEVIADYFTSLKIPVFYNVKYGHIKDTMTIPFGIKCRINTSRGFIEFTEGAVI